jgi:hypothetical protein
MWLVIFLTAWDVSTASISLCRTLQTPEVGTLITRRLSVSFYWLFAMQITALRSLMLGGRVESQMAVYFGRQLSTKDGKKNPESTQS